MNQKAINDGGTAFPVLERDHQGLGLSSTGMSLRDHYAGLAMQALVSGAMADGTPFQITAVEMVAKAAHLIADAMISERFRP